MLPDPVLSTRAIRLRPWLWPLTAGALFLSSCGGDSPAEPAPDPPMEVPPSASIVSPGAGASFGEGQEVLFRGTGRDGTGQPLPGDALSWSSDRDGDLGRGEELGRSNLSAGDHRIRLRATDSRGRSATDSVAVRVLPPPSVAIGSPLDGSLHWAGVAVTFEGSAEDAEGITLDGDALAWESNRDGSLGPGARLNVEDLSEGTHEITLTATDPRGTTVSTRISITVGSAAIERPIGGTPYPEGVPITFQTRARDLEGVALTWESDRDGLIGEDGDFSVHQLSRGLHQVTLTAAAPGGATTLAQVQFRVTPGFHLEGQLHPLPGRSIPALETRARSGSFEGVATVSAEGHFSVLIPEPSQLDSLVVLVDSPDSETRTHFPIYLNFGGTVPASSSWLPPDVAPDTVFHHIRAALVPMTWTIDEGPFAGQEVALSLEAASTPAQDGLSYFFSQDIGSLIDAAWPQDLLPIPLAFHHDSTHAPITAADSAAFWEAVEKLEDRFGEPLFVPAIHPEGEGLRSMGRIAVAVDTTLAAAASASPWWWRPFHQDTQTHGQVRLFSAPIRFQRVDGLRNEWLVMHEVAHALGLGHTCAWASILGGGGSGCSGAQPSAHDVAHEQVKRAVANLRLQADEPGARIVFGLEYSRLGERVVLLGLPPYRASSTAPVVLDGPLSHPRVEVLEMDETGWRGRLRFHGW